MPPNLEIHFENLAPSEAIEARIRDKFNSLTKFHNRILGGRVTVEAPHRHRQHDHLYHVRIHLDLPNDVVDVSKEHWQDEAHRDVYVTIRDAFEAAKRQLQDHVRRQRGEVKTNEKPPRGRIVRIFPEQGYGFLEGEDGREIYFDQNSVLHGGFSQLVVGQQVKYSAEMGEEGPQASTVMI
jgi:cold shock CspA family protein